MAETVNDVLDLVRDVTQDRGVSDTVLLSFINSFYQNKFWVDLNMSSITEMWNFQTLANTGEYSVPQAYRLIKNSTIEINGCPFNLYRDEVEFDSIYNEGYIIGESVGTGDAVEQTFTGTLTQYPVLPKSMIATDNVETFKDIDGDGILTGSLGGSGTIVYATGVYSITFNTIPVLDSAIVSTYARYVAGSPEAALFYNNIIKFRPIPDGTYDINIEVAKRPTLLAVDGAIPDTLWGDAIAYGTSIDRYNRRGDFDNASRVQMIYLEHLATILGKGYKVTSKLQRIQPRW